MVDSSPTEGSRGTILHSRMDSAKTPLYFLDPFITSEDYGNVICDVRAKYFKVTFNLSEYTDDLYSRHGIEFPSHIKRAAVKRRAEYLAGRMCCKACLLEMGVEGIVSSRAGDRQPIWPDGLNGSISHCKEYAIAIIVPKDVGSVGIDIEELDSEALTESVDVFSTDMERTKFLQNDYMDRDASLLLAFSAKETFFKAVYPQLQLYFGFEYASLDLVLPSEFRLRLNRTLTSKLQKDSVFAGLYNFDRGSGIIITFMLIRK